MSRIFFLFITAVLLATRPAFAADQGPLDAINQLTLQGPIPNSPWLHPGLRLSYTGKHATIQGANFTLVPNGGGFFQDPNGNRFDLVRRETSFAGIVVDQDTIAAIDGDNVITSTRSFVYDPLHLNDPPQPVGMTGAVTSYRARNIGARFVDPAILQPYLTNPAQGITAVHEPFIVQGQTFDAISICYRDNNSQTLNIYDLKTGLQLRWVNYTLDAAPNVIISGDVPHGDAHIHIVDFIAARDLQIPGGPGPLPALFTTLSGVRANTSTRYVQMTNTTPALAQTVFQIANHGAGWLELQAPNAANPAQPTRFTYGSAQFLGWWMNPAGLAELQQGQVLDQDPVTHSQVDVSSVDSRLVIIRDTTSNVTLEVAYSRASGICVSYRYLGGSPETEVVCQLTDVQ